MALPDGSYSYNIIGTLSPAQVQYSEVKQNLDQGREPGAEPTNVPVGVIESGVFQILGGQVVTDDGSVEE
jgi:hypothetical protein